MEKLESIQLLSKSKAAKLLHKSRNTVSKLIKEGRISTITIMKRESISLMELERFVNDEAKKKQFVHTISKTEKGDNNDKTNSFSGKMHFQRLIQEALHG